MAEPQYRFGGPIPERAQWLKKRREWRASSLFATVKRGRARDREEKRAADRAWYGEALKPFARGNSPVVDVDLASGAPKSIGLPLEKCTLEHGLDPLVEARLADVVQRLRACWIAGPARLWTDIHSIREMPAGEFDKRVATTFASGFFQFSQFLAGFEVLVLELQKSGVVSKKTLLSLEQLLQKGGGFFVDEVGVAGCAQSLGNVSSCGD